MQYGGRSDWGRAEKWPSASQVEYHRRSTTLGSKLLSKLIFICVHGERMTDALLRVCRNDCRRYCFLPLQPSGSGESVVLHFRAASSSASRLTFRTAATSSEDKASSLAEIASEIANSN